MYKEIFMEF
jgi:hypothetical protein